MNSGSSPILVHVIWSHTHNVLCDICDILFYQNAFSMSLHHLIKYISLLCLHTQIYLHNGPVAQLDKFVVPVRSDTYHHNNN